MTRKKRVNIYLNALTITRADELARKLSYELGTEVNRSNVFELALEILRKQENVNDLVRKELSLIKEEDE